MLNQTLVTSSGIVRNRLIPRSGIVNASSLYSELFDDCINSGIDLSWESYREDTLAQLTRDNPDLDESAIDELFDAESQDICFESRVFLLGAWIKNSKGQYVIDKTGENGDYALEYNTETGIVCVEWSKDVTWCHNTSPCYVMSDGSGPCGDLDTKGSVVLAYTLPFEMFHKE